MTAAIRRKWIVPLHISRRQHPPEQLADRDELLGRASLRQGAFAPATELAEHAADLRREAPDYRGMVRALAVAADAAARRGHAQLAADLYLRAERGSPLAATRY